MMRPAVVVMADDGVPFDGTSLERGPLGGAETAFIGLAEGLAARGHRVLAFTNGVGSVRRNGVDWAPIGELPDSADLYIANRGHRLLDRVPGARRTAFWIHNPAGYLLKWRYLWRLLKRRPVIVTLGAFHASTLPSWVPAGGRRIIPYGISDAFRGVSEVASAVPQPAPPPPNPPPQAGEGLNDSLSRETGEGAGGGFRRPPPPKAIFTSNPLRRLDWVLEIWAEAIHPSVPAAELHLYSSLETYGVDAGRYPAAARVLEQARALAGAGVVLHPPVSKAALAGILAETRVLLYGGDPGETFCLAVAEAQAAGVPCVVARSTCLAERVDHDVTGYVLEDDDRAGFAERAVALLTDDALWRRRHTAALDRRRGLSWVDAAGLWEALLP